MRSKLKDTYKLKHLFQIVFPAACLSCGKELRPPEQFICLHCESNWYYEEKLLLPNNIINQLFWGKCNILFAGALFNFVKGESIQKIIHQFKYKGQQKLALQMGTIMAKKLEKQKHLKPFDYVIAVPSTAKKRKQRGYNQAEILAEGLAQHLGLKHLKKILKKEEHKESQTSKNVIERYENMEHSIQLNLPDENLLANKHLLIVDDVITTGATLCACANSIQKKVNCEISILALAYRNI